MYFSYEFDKIKVKKLVDDAVIPAYQTEGAAAFDLHIVEEVNLWRHCFYLCKTGLAIEIPKGFFGYIRPRSGLAIKKNIGILSSNVIDSDYRGEIMVNLYNAGDSLCKIEKYSRIAQMLILPAPHFQIIEVDELGDTVRGEGGFGSTGGFNG